MDMPAHWYTLTFRIATTAKSSTASGEPALRCLTIAPEYVNAFFVSFSAFVDNLILFQKTMPLLRGILEDFPQWRQTPPQITFFPH